MICWATRHWLQRCLCRRRSRRGVSITGPTRRACMCVEVFLRVTQRVCDCEQQHAWTVFYPNKRTSNFPGVENFRGDQGQAFAPWPPEQALLRGSENTLYPPPRSLSASVSDSWFHVPAVVLHFLPVSNGGPGADLSSEECVLLLIHRTARSFCAPVREVSRAAVRERSPGRRSGPGFRGKLRCVCVEPGHCNTNLHTTYQFPLKTELLWVSSKLPRVFSTLLSKSEVETLSVWKTATLWRPCIKKDIISIFVPYDFETFFLFSIITNFSY